MTTHNKNNFSLQDIDDNCSNALTNSKTNILTCNKNSQLTPVNEDESLIKAKTNLSYQIYKDMSLSH